MAQTSGSFLKSGSKRGRSIAKSRLKDNSPSLFFPSRVSYTKPQSPGPSNQSASAKLCFVSINTFFISFSVKLVKHKTRYLFYPIYWGSFSHIELHEFSEHTSKIVDKANMSNIFFQNVRGRVHFVTEMSKSLILYLEIEIAISRYAI